MGVSAIIFDLDGVLIDTEALHEEANRIAFARFGLAMPEGICARFRGRSDADMARHVAERIAAPGFDHRDYMAAKHAAFSAIQDRIQAVPGALDFLRAARGRFAKLAVATSAAPQDQDFAFRRFGLAPHIDVVVNAGDITHAKPHPEPYLKTVAKLGLPADASLVIEDSRNGILSAKAAGCPVAGITTSFTAAELEETRPDFLVASFPELADILGIQGV